jgi:hypothetical protein
MHTTRTSNMFVGNASGHAEEPIRILAAIVDPADPVSGRIVADGARLAQRVGGELHVGSAYSVSSPDAQSCRVERYLPALRVKARDRRRCAIRQLLRRSNVEVAGIHVQEGEMHQVIGALAASLQACAVVDAATLDAAGAHVLARLPTPSRRTSPVRKPAPAEFAA